MGNARPFNRSINQSVFTPETRHGTLLIVVSDQCPVLSTISTGTYDPSERQILLAIRAQQHVALPTGLP